MATATLTYLINMRAEDARRETRSLGTDAKSTEKSLRGASEEVSQLSKEARTAARDLRSMGRDLRSVGGGLGQVSGSSGKATKAIGALVAGLGGLSGLTAVGGPIALGLGAVAIGLLGTGVAAVKFGAYIADATANAREYAAELSALQGIGTIEGPISEETLSALETASGAIDGLSAIAKEVSLAFATEFAPEIEAAGLLVVSLGLIVADFAKTSIEKIRLFFKSLESADPLLKKFLNVSTLGIAGQVNQIKKALEDGSFAAGSYLDRAKDLIGSLSDTETASRGAADGLREQASALSELENVKKQKGAGDKQQREAEFERARAEFEREFAPVTVRAGQEEAQQNLLSLSADLRALTATEQAQLEIARLTADLTRGLITGEQYKEGVSIIEGRLQQNATIAAEEARKAQRISADQLASGLGLAGTAASGDLLGLLSAGGPIAGGVGALIGGIVDLGASGADQVAEELETFRRQLIAGIGLLPELFGEVIPQFAEALAETLPGAILEALPAIVAALSDLISAGGQAERAAGALEALDIPVISEIAGIASEAIGTVRDFRTSIFGGSRDRGGAISRPGLYFLHPGEYVQRNNGQSDQRARASNNGASVRIQLRNPALFGYRQEIDRIYGPGGLREDF